jgi:uncharacterized protein (TIRG00374 family)
MSLRWELVARAMDRKNKISTMTYFMDRLAGYSVSYLTPMAQLGGEPLRIMLIEESGLEHKAAVNSTVIEKAMEISTTGIFVATGCLVASFDSHLPTEMRPWLVATAVILLSVIVIFYLTSIFGKGFLTSVIKFLHLHRSKKLTEKIKKIEKFEEELNAFYSKNPMLTLGLILISISTMLVMLLEHFLIVYFLGVKMTFFQTFLITTIPYAAYMTPVPGGVGVLESSMALVFQVLGLNLSSIALILILRSRDLLFVIAGLIKGSHKAWKMLKDDYRKELGL